MEVLIFASVIGTGYFLNQNKKNSNILTNTYTGKLSNSEPSGLNIYQSNKVNEIKKNELIKSNRLYKLAESPSLTGVIPPFFNSLYDNLDEGKTQIRQDTNDTLHPIEFKKYTSDNSSKVLENIFINPNSQQSSILNNVNRYINPIASKNIALQNRPMFKSTAPINNDLVLSEELSFGSLNEDNTINQMTGLPYDTSHNNEVPFFGSNVKETFNNHGLLEKFTGTQKEYKNKIETNINGINGPDNIYGSAVLTSTIAADTDRYIVSRFRQNEKPIPEERVSYQKQGGLDDFIRPQYKKIEDLVVNPKSSYQTRTKSGTYPSKPADLPSFSKNTPDTLYEDAIDRSFVKSDVSKGLFAQDYTKSLGNPQRENQSIDYNGNVGNSSLYNGKQQLVYCNDEFDENGLQKSCVNLPFKNETTNNYKGNISKIGSVNDFGRDSVQLPNTHRITTNSQRISSFNGHKKGTKRLQDVLPITLKETLPNIGDRGGNIQNEHNYGLSESTNRGINSLNAKTTLKEDASIITNKYTAVANKNQGLGYLTNKVKAKITLKELLTNQSEYMGNPSSQDKKSHELRDQYNTINFKNDRGNTLKRNNTSGPQRFGKVADKDSVFTNEIRLSDSQNARNKEVNRENLNVSFPSTSRNYPNIGQNRNDRKKDNENNRFGNGLHLDQLKNNPYNIL